MNEKAPAGWYPSGDDGDLRWWDGTAWTEHRQPAPSTSAPPPEPEPVATQPPAAKPDEPDVGQPKKEPATLGEQWQENRAGCIAMIVIALVLFLVVGSCLAGGGDDTKSSDGAKEKPSATKTVPKTPKGKLQAAVDQTSAKKPRVNEYFTIDGVTHATVQFSVQDNLTNGMTRTGIAQDVFAMAEAALKSKVPFDEIAFRGMFPLSDVYGNTKPGQVFYTTFDRTELKKVNFDNVLVTKFSNIKNLSKDGIVVLHPDLRK